MEFKNYTGVDIIISAPGTVVQLPVDGYAEVGVNDDYSIGDLVLTNDGQRIPVRCYAPRVAKDSTGQPETPGLPADRPGVIHIVENEVAEALKNYRGDLVYPYMVEVRTGRGGTITCRGLAFPTK